MKFTDWFPGEIKPVHIGVYQIRAHLPIYSYWDGDKFNYISLSIEKANKFKNNEAPRQNYTWRGITK